MPRLLSIVTAALLTCAGAVHAREVTSLLETRRADVVIQKFDISCGAAAEATLLHLKFGDDVSEREVALGLVSRKEYLANPNLVRIREGFSLLDLKRFADSRGYRSEGLGQMSLSDLAAVAPAIVPLRLHGYNHFVVFRGLTGDRVALADPAYGNRTMKLDRFLDAWLPIDPLGHVAFVINGDGEP